MHNYIKKSNKKTFFSTGSVPLRDTFLSNSDYFLQFELAIESFGGHCSEHFKKNVFTMKIKRVACILIFVCMIIFELAVRAKLNFLNWQAKHV